MKRILLLLVVGFCLITRCFSQDYNFVDGYIIDKDSKLSFVELAYRKGEQVYFSCVSKSKNGQIRKYSPQELNGYGYVGGTTYNTVTEDSIFAEVVIKGFLSLWKFKNQFYLNQGGDVLKVGTNQTDKVKSVLGSCLEPSLIDKKLKNNEASLKNLVIDYNECNNEDFKVFEKKKANLQIELGAYAGVVNSSLNFSENQNYEYLKGSYKSVDPFYGAILNLASPKMVEGLSAQLELQFSSSSYSSLTIIEESNETRYHDSFIEINDLSIPFSFKYSLIQFARIKPYIQAGIEYRKLSTETRVQTETVQGGVVSTEPEQEAVKIKESVLNAWYGIGLIREFEPIKGELFVRYHFADISDVDRLSSQQKQISVGVLISVVKSIHK